jgi:hypothetical protein
VQFIYRLFACVLGIFGAAAALGINTFYSVSTRFQSVIGAHPDPSHGWLGLGCAILAFIGALFLLFRESIPLGVVLLLIAGIGFFFVVGWWALLASPAMFIAAFYAAYYYFDQKQRAASQQAASQGQQPMPERPPPETGTPAVG